MTKSGRQGPAPELDFLSPEFNRIDPLQDAAGNFRSFETLQGVVTADMRHQAERARAGAAVAADRVGAPADSGGAARAEAQPCEAAEPLIVISHGRVLIVDADASRALACGRRLGGQGLACTMIVTGDEGAAGAPTPAARALLREARSVAITGAFGGFSAVATPRTAAETQPGGATGEPERFDCVLDLQQTPSYAGRPPLGYYAPGADPARLEGALAELPQMRGRFEKPRFTTFVERRCLRGRARAGDCRRCVEACPFGAIQVGPLRIAVDDAACQGCGGCSLVCPSGALRMAHPFASDQLGRLREALAGPHAGSGEPVVLTIRETGAAGPDAGARKSRHGPRARGIAFDVEHIAQVRLETLLFALAWGADVVVVDCPADAEPRISEALRRQTSTAAGILLGCGLSGERIHLAAAGAAEPSPIPAAAFSGGATAVEAGGAPGATPDDTRSLARAAAQVLFKRSGARERSLALPAGAGFGAVDLAGARCTLCMACVAACPCGALSARGDAPRLQFRESLCWQCGLCAEVCPEGALRLRPRLLCDPAAVDAPAVLHEAEAARCPDCGAAFASRAMVERMRDRLRGHWMYADERQLRRLGLCGACRARDTLGSEDVRRWNR